MTGGIPETFPATGTDLAVNITRVAGVMHRIGLHMRLGGRLDANRLRRATRLLLDAEPILGCAFEPEKKRWRRLGDLDGRVPFSVIETGDPEGEGVAFQAEEVPDSGPQAAVRLFRRADHDELGVKVSHVLADGQAVKQCAYLLAEVYTALGRDAAHRPTANLRPRPTELDVWDALTAEQQRAAKKAANWQMPNWPAPFRGKTGRALTYRTLTLSPERFRALKSYGKERRATVNDMLVAAYFRALVARLDPPANTPLSLMATADHRRYLNDAGGLPVANLSISGSLDIERVDGETYDDTLSRSGACMAKWAATCYGAAPARGAEKMAKMPYALMRALIEPGLRLAGRSGKTLAYLTNIGVIDEERLRLDAAAPVEARMYGPCAGAGPSIVAAVSTYRDSLTLTMGFCSEDMDESVIASVLGGTERELAAVSS